MMKINLDGKLVALALWWWPARRAVTGSAPPQDPRGRARTELERLRKSKWITTEADEPAFDLDELDVLTRELASDEETLLPRSC